MPAWLSVSLFVVTLLTSASLHMQLRGRNLVPFTFDKQTLLLETLYAIWRCVHDMHLWQCAISPQASGNVQQAMRCWQHDHALPYARQHWLPHKTIE